MLLVVGALARVRQTWFQKESKAQDPVKGDFEVFNQYIDHFDNTNTATFSQRFLSNPTYFKEGGPLYVFIGGEAPLPAAALEEKYSISYFAKETNGWMVALEHRYYGESRVAASMEDMRFLSSKQAIADLSTFIPWVKQQKGLPADTKVIVLGGSYAGNLAGWARQQLPFLIDAAIATSGPAMGELDFLKYMQHAQDQVLKVGGQECYNNLTNALKYLNNLLEQDLAAFKEIFQLKKGQIVDNFGAKDIASVQSYMSQVIVGTIQTHKATNFDGAGTLGSIQTFCQDFMVNLTKDSTERDVALAYTVMNPLNEEGDLSFAGMLKCLQETEEVNDCASSRAWVYQTCTEFGYYQSTNYEGSIWGTLNELTWSLKLCYEAFFSDLFTEEKKNEFPKTQELVQDGIDFTNAWYGARNQPRTHVFYTNGDVDPWSELAVVDGLKWIDGQFTQESAMEWVKGSSHCSDFYLSHKINDPVRERQLAKLREWIHV